MNSWGYFLSTPEDGKTISVKGNCDSVTGRYKIIDIDLYEAKREPKT